MNYHLFQLICRFKLVHGLITLEKAATGREKMRGKKEDEQRDTDGKQQDGLRCNTSKIVNQLEFCRITD